MKCQRLFQAYNVSEGQIRVVLGFHQELSGYAAGGISTGIISFSDMANTDDFLSFSAQYLEFRVRAIRFDVYDLQPNNTSVVNYWSTYHTVGGLQQQILSPLWIVPTPVPYLLVMVKLPLLGLLIPFLRWAFNELTHLMV